jgi:hypothetical protein
MSRNTFPLALSRSMSERRSAWWNASLGGVCLGSSIFVGFVRLRDALGYRRTNPLAQGVLTGIKTAQRRKGFVESKAL